MVRAVDLPLVTSIKEFLVTSEPVPGTPLGPRRATIDSVISVPVDIPTGLTGAITLRTILLDSQVSRMLRGTGNGSTDAAARIAETAKFQEILNTGRSFAIPEPLVTYAVNSLSPVWGQLIVGSGQFHGPQATQPHLFTGNGVDPVFLIGDGTGNPRWITIRDLSIFNNGGKCVYANTAPNLIIDQCRITSVNAHAIDMILCYRAKIVSSYISTGGAFTAIRGLNNINGLEISQCTITGGPFGRAIQIGQSQGIRINNNIVESSLDGIWVGSTSDSGDGNCNGVEVNNNYIEQCSTPIVLAKRFSVFGLSCLSNYIGNSIPSVVSARAGAITFGRIRSATVKNNAAYFYTSWATGDVVGSGVYRKNGANIYPVSYTHLTLPTICSV